MSSPGKRSTPSPCNDQSRKRSREVPGTTSPLQSLLEQIRRLKLPSIDQATANSLLKPWLLKALEHDDKGTLLEAIQPFGWSSTGFSKTVDLGMLSLVLQRYRYERLQELGQGSYAIVYKARNRETDEVIALKKLRFGFDEQGLPSSTLREISLLKELKHANIVELKDIIYGFGTNNVYVVLECLDCDLRDLLDGEKPLDTWRVKSFLYQILKAIHHAHMHCVMHRDLKPQNILVAANHQQVKVADFGLARNFLPPFKAYTDKVVTLWYRAPELLLGVNSYSAAIDMWSVGCIFAEMLNREPLFRSECEIGLLYKIFEALGTPDDSMWAGVERLQYYRRDFPRWQAKEWAHLVPRLAHDPVGTDLLANMLSYNPEARITAGQALKHPWFDDIRRSEARSAIAAAGSSAQQRIPSLAALTGASRLLPVARSLGAGMAPQQQQPAQSQLLQQQLPHIPMQVQYPQALGQQQHLQAGQLQHPAYGYGQQVGAAVGPVATANWATMPLSALQPAMPQRLPQQQQQIHPTLTVEG